MDPLQQQLCRTTGRIAYYTAGILRDLMPYARFEAKRRVLFQHLAGRPDDAADLFARVRAYNQMASGSGTAGMHPVRSIPRKRSYYYFDLKIDAKHFGPHRQLRHRFGDVTKVPPEPTIVKSRPIRADNANAVVMKLDRLRALRSADGPAAVRGQAALCRLARRGKQPGPQAPGGAICDPS